MTSNPEPSSPNRGDLARQALQQGVALHRLGRLDDAEQLYQKAVELLPDDPVATHLLGLVALNRGQLPLAADLIRRALSRSPNFADAHLNLGNVLQAQGRLEEAAACYRRAIALRPGQAMAHSNLCRVLNELGQSEAAIESGRTAVALDPTLSAGHINLGAALVRAKRIAEAETAYLRATMLEPNRAETHRDLGSVLMELDRLDEALICHDRALALNTDDAASHCARALVLVRKSDLAAAENSFRRAIELDPVSADAWLGLAWSLRLLGRFAEADTCFERVRVLDPSRMEAYRNLATPGPAPSSTEQIDRLATELDAEDKSTPDRIVAGFALGRLLDNSDRYDEAFARYRMANTLVKQTNDTAGIRFDYDVFRRRVDLLIEHQTTTTFLTPIGPSSELPVFIVGMPRSGTTLTEQIAASHSQVFGAGELQDIGRIADNLTQGSREVTAHQADAELAVRLAHAHLSRLADQAAGASRVIDKMPDNVLHLGLIALLYPKARIIFCTRNAYDISLSCYFQLFSEGLHPFAYDLADCGRRSVEVNRVMAHWQAVLPLRMHIVNYEKLVANLEAESRRLIAFLGLPWEPACLDFHRTERTVTTVSHWQVRQPLYTRSVGRWRHYRKHLGPLFEVLGPPE